MSDDFTTSERAALRELLSQMRSVRGPGVTVKPSGITIAPPAARQTYPTSSTPAPAVFVARILGSANPTDGTGSWYLGRILKGKPSSATGVGRTSRDDLGGIMEEEVDCLVLSLWELGLPEPLYPSGHPDLFAEGHIVGNAAALDAAGATNPYAGRPIVVADRFYGTNEDGTRTHEIIDHESTIEPTLMDWRIGDGHPRGLDVNAAYVCKVEWQTITNADSPDGVELRLIQWFRMKYYRCGILVAISERYGPAVIVSSQLCNPETGEGGA